MTNSLLKIIGLLSALALSGCTKSIDFSDGEDKINLKHEGPTYEKCEGRIMVNVVKKDGTRMLYGGGKNMFLDDAPGLKYCEIFTSRNPAGRLVEKNNADAYRNYTNYIRMAESIYREETEKALSGPND
jgi:hypothetical protein